MISKCAIHWQGLVQAISRYRFEKRITRGRSTAHGGSSCPTTPVPVLKLYYQRTKIQPDAGDGRSSTKLLLPKNENPAGRPVLKLYYQRTKIQLAAGHSRSSTRLVLPMNGRKSSRTSETAVPVLKLYYQRMEIQPAAGHGGSSTRVVLPENENPAGRWRRPCQY